MASIALPLHRGAPVHVARGQAAPASRLRCLLRVIEREAPGIVSAGGAPRAPDYGSRGGLPFMPLGTPEAVARKTAQVLIGQAVPAFGLGLLLQTLQAIAQAQSLMDFLAGFW